MDNEAIHIADDQQRRVLQCLAVLLELLVGGFQVFVFALVFPGEVIAEPDIGPALAAAVLFQAALESVKGAVRVGRRRLGLVQHFAKIKKMVDDFYGYNP